MLNDLQDGEAAPPWVYRDRAEFSPVNAGKGRHRLLPPLEAQAVRDRQRRYRQPRPPRIQETLRRALQLKDRLALSPGLTRDALARESGINPSQLTKILRLADLAPEIQRHILELPPVAGQSLITERRLRAIAIIQDHVTQILRFRELLNSPLRTHEHLPSAAPSQPSCQPGT